MLKIRILAPDKEIYAGEAESFSSTNSSGTFDILPGHAKFVTLVENKPLIIRSSGGQKTEFTFPLAIIHVKQDQVNAYVNPVL